MNKIRVLLADDHTILRAGLQALLNTQADLQVVGQADNGEAALQLAKQLEPDVVLLDISMPRMDGLTALRQFQHDLPHIRVLILTMYEDETFLRQVLAAGGAGYLLKKAAEGELLMAIRAVARGETFVDPALTHTLVDAYLGRAEEPASPAPQQPKGLSSRETQVLCLIALGYTNQQIAEKLVLSVKTVETHKGHVQEKLGLHTRMELVRYAMTHGLIREFPDRSRD